MAAKGMPAGELEPVDVAILLHHHHPWDQRIPGLWLVAIDGPAVSTRVSGKGLGSRDLEFLNVLA